MKVEFSFYLRDVVRIKELNIRGLVVGVFYGETGDQYQVSYFYDGELKTVYLYAEQLEKLTSFSSMGYQV